jgi:MarC family membrane protein
MDQISFSTIAGSLFLVLNAWGQIPLFLGLLGNFSEKRQRIIILREMAIALGILLLFCFFGEGVFLLLGITRSVVGMAGGILLFLIALSMIFPKQESQTETLKREPMVIPLAIPAITGPGAITMTMAYAQASGPFLVSLAVLTAWLPSLLILLAGSYLKRLLGEKGLVAVERFGGMIVCLIGVNMFGTFAIEFVQQQLAK